MAKRGAPVTRVVNDGVAAAAAADAASLVDESDEEAADGDETSTPMEGITDEQAARIREAVRAAKRGRHLEG